jgi:hypothetical protein
MDSAIMISDNIKFMVTASSEHNDLFNSDKNFSPRKHRGLVLDNLSLKYLRKNMNRTLRII